MHFEVHPDPCITPFPNPPYEIYEKYGLEDPRITQIGDVYYLVYTAYGPHGPRVGIGYTKDFEGFDPAIE